MTLDLEGGGWHGSASSLNLVKVIQGEVVDSFETIFYAADYYPSPGEESAPSDRNNYAHAANYDEVLQFVFNFVGDLPVLGNRYGSFERHHIDDLLGYPGAAWPTAWVEFTEIAGRAYGEEFAPSLNSLMRDSELEDLLREPVHGYELGSMPAAWMMSYLFEEMKWKRQLITDGDMERFTDSWVKFEPTPGIVRAYLHSRTPRLELRFPLAGERPVIGVEEKGALSTAQSAADDHRNQVIMDGLAVDHRCDQVVIVNEDTSRTRLVYDPGVRVDDYRRLVTLNAVAELRSYIVVHYRTTGYAPFEVGAVKVEDGVVTKVFSSLIQTSEGPSFRDETGLSLYALEQAPKLSEVMKSIKAFAGGLPVVIMSDQWPSHDEMREPFGPLLLANAWVDLAQLAGRSHRKWRNLKRQSLLDAHDISHSGEPEKEPAADTAWALCRLFEEIRLKEKRITPEAYSRFIASWEGWKPATPEDYLAIAGQSDFVREWAGKTVSLAGKFSLMRKDELEAVFFHAGITLNSLTKATDMLIWGGSESPERVRPEKLTVAVRKALTDKKTKGRELAVFSEAEVVQALGLTKARFAPLVAAPVAARTHDPVSPPTLVTPSLSMFAASSSTPDLSTMNKPLQSAAPATKLSMFSVPPAAPPGPKLDMFSPGHGKPQKSTAEGAAKPKMPWD